MKSKIGVTVNKFLHHKNVMFKNVMYIYALLLILLIPLLFMLFTNYVLNITL